MSGSTQTVPKWTRAEARPALERKFRFQNRIAAWGFVAKLAIVLNIDEFYVEWTGSRVKIILTWGDAGPSADIFALAERINDIV